MSREKHLLAYLKQQFDISIRMISQEPATLRRHVLAQFPPLDDRHFRSLDILVRTPGKTTAPKMFFLRPGYPKRRDSPPHSLHCMSICRTSQ